METQKNNYFEMVRNCKISEATAGFIACILALNDLNSQVADVIQEVYGEAQVDCVIEREYSKKSDELNDILLGFLSDNIHQNICCNNFDEI